MAAFQTSIVDMLFRLVINLWPECIYLVGLLLSTKPFPGNPVYILLLAETWRGIIFPPQVSQFPRSAV